MYSYKKISMYSYKKVSLLLRRLYWLVEPSHRFFEWKQEICLLKSVIENEKNTLRSCESNKCCFDMYIFVISV